ncbi:MAG TPA: DUF423 domain-containing protein [Polyangiales bacterium]
MTTERIFLALAGANGFVAVALGAFGAHGLRSALASAPDGAHRLEVWETAARYQMMHALALGLVAYLCTRTSSSAAVFAGWSMQAGIVIFCGSLYALTLSGVRGLGAITPLGGLCMLAGWASVVAAALTVRTPG